MSSTSDNTSSSQHRIKLVKNPNFVKDGKMAYGHVLRKFGFKPTLDYPFQVTDEIVHAGGWAHRANEHAHGRHENVATRKMMTTDEHGQAGDVQAQDVSQLWSTELSASAQASGKAAHHNIFDPTKSSTFKKSPGQSWNITYGDGSYASGDVGTDVVNVGGINVQNQSVELANKMSSSFTNSTGDGLLGLAFGKINTVHPAPVHTPVENMIMQSSIGASSQLFTAYLGSYKDVNDPDQGQSFYTFGYIDQSAVASSNSSIWYTPVNDQNGFWQFTSANYSVNGQVHPVSGGSAIADTGTTLALVDDATCKAIYAAIPGSKFSTSMGGYTFPSNTALTALPDVRFDVGGKMFAVSKDDLAYHDYGNGYSYGGIQSRGQLPFNIYGDTWLKGVYAIFDVGQKRFGCVQRIDAPNNTSSPPAKSCVACPTGDAAKKCEKHDETPDAHAPASASHVAVLPAAGAPQVPVVVPVASPSAPNAAAPAPTPGDH